MTRSLLLKGLAGVAALGGTTVGGLVAFNKDLFGWGKGAEEPKSEDLSKFNQKELIDKVGLNCGLEGNDLTDNTPKDCTVKENGTINVRRGERDEEEGVKYSSETSKLKVSRDEGYLKNLKFVVDSGDLELTGGNSTIGKLEQFETYEVFLKEDGKFFLSRKTDARDGKRRALELPTGEGKCSLPESGDSDCTLTIEEAKKVKFEGQSQEITVTGNSVTLKVSKVEDTTTFPDGYRFTFTFPGDVSINNKQLKGNTPYDFKIKKHDNSNNLTLEKAWSDDNDFAKRAGLECTGSNNECSVPAGSQKLNVKVGDSKREGIGSKSGSGKIKMETDQPGYNQGLKFTITEGDVTISDGTASGTGGDITKLEELETYEITEEKGKFYLSLKTSKNDGIKSSLSLPQGCDLPTAETPVDCTLSADAFKNINFKDKSDASVTGEVKLKISKTSSEDFPLGYKFTFNTTSEATIKTSSTTIKANIPTDFKIKKEEGKVSLEKAWSDNDYSFAKKAGLECTTDSGTDGCCSQTSGASINVKKGTDSKTGITSVTTTGSGKIKVEKEQAGYNQGLKFTITGGDVSLTGGSGTGNFDKLEELETYEITEEGGKYYLTRKDEASKTIVDLLGLTDAGCSLSTTPCTLSTEQIKKVKFDGKDANGPTASANATLTITKTDKKEDFPLGYKFTLQSQQEITIKNANDANKVKANISTDFKIKKDTTTPTNLSLEKAWTMDSLGKKVGLSCTNNNGDECTIANSGNTLKVKQLSENDNEIKQTALTKKANDSNSKGKIKVTKDQEGYNQGFKFEISEGSIELSGTTGSDEGEKITRLGEYETYEIKEIGKEWFLSIKNKADDFVLKELGLKNIEGCSSLKLPRSTTASDCRIEKVEVLKKIKFGNATSHSWPSSVDAQLMIGLDSGLPAGFKFTFTNSSSTSLCLPDGNGGKVEVTQSNNSGVVYKIKKSGSGTGATLCLEKHNGNGSSSC